MHTNFIFPIVLVVYVDPFEKDINIDEETADGTCEAEEDTVYMNLQYLTEAAPAIIEFAAESDTADLVLTICGDFLSEYTESAILRLDEQDYTACTTTNENPTTILEITDDDRKLNTLRNKGSKRKPFYPLNGTLAIVPSKRVLLAPF